MVKGELSPSAGRFAGLSDPRPAVRLETLREAAAAEAAGDLAVLTGRETNNHIHTTYSFSPYHPAHGAFMAWTAGLAAAGSVDHDSISGAEEMLEACRILGIGSTVGAELRVNFKGTALEHRKINNPDTPGNGYIIFHGVPHQNIPALKEFLAPINAARNSRNRKQVERLNGLIAGTGLSPLDFDRDVAPLSLAVRGGSVTERHILYALSLAIIGLTGKGEALTDFLRDALGINPGGKLRGYLADRDNPHYAYDLLGVLKAEYLPGFFIQPEDHECVPAAEAAAFANSIGAIPAYSYLGDVAESPTGDKKSESFEDAFLDGLFVLIREMDFKAVAYMPPRNTLEQLNRVKALCGRYGFMEISGVDINSSRQSFNCPELLMPEFSHLIDNTWALIAHEHMASADLSRGLFHPDNPLASLPLTERIRRYARLGRSMDLKNPDSVFDKRSLLEARA